jgi:hypothetical protein
VSSKKSKKKKKIAPTKVTPAGSAAATQTASNPAFQGLAAARASISGLAAFTPSKLSRRATNFVTDKYFSLILQNVDQNADLKAATGIDTAQVRAKLIFVNSLSSFPAACLALANDVSIYLDTMLLEMSNDAREATAWLAWKAKKSKDTNAAKTVAQLRAMPKGRGVTIPKKKKRASPGSAGAADASATSGTTVAKKPQNGAKSAAQTNGTPEPSPPAPEASVATPGSTASDGQP